MWLFLNECALSVVQHNKDHNKVVVRARVEGDLQRFLSTYAPDCKAKVKATPVADYAYRIEMGRAQFANALTQAALSIDYTNFKASVPDDRRHDAYFSVWSAWQSAARRMAMRPAWTPRMRFDGFEEPDFDQEAARWERWDLGVDDDPEAEECMVCGCRAGLGERCDWCECHHSRD